MEEAIVCLKDGLALLCLSDVPCASQRLEEEAMLLEMEEVEDNRGYLNKVIEDGAYINGTGFELAKLLGMYEPQRADTEEDIAGVAHPLTVGNASNALDEKRTTKRQAMASESARLSRVFAGEEGARGHFSSSESEVSRHDEDVKRLVQSIYEKRDTEAREQNRMEDAFGN